MRRAHYPPTPPPRPSPVMPQVTIPETSDPTDAIQGFLDSITIPADGVKPPIPLLVKVYPGQRWWYIVAYTSDGRIVCPLRNLCTSDNVWAAQEAGLKDMFGRAVSCSVTGETDATKPLFGQCTITIDALADSGPEIVLT